LARTDYSGVYHGGESNGYGFFKKDGTYLDIDLQGQALNETGKKKLVEILEKDAGKKGRTR